MIIEKRQNRLLKLILVLLRAFYPPRPSLGRLATPPCGAWRGYVIRRCWSYDQQPVTSNQQPAFHFLPLGRDQIRIFSNSFCSLNISSLNRAASIKSKSRAAFSISFFTLPIAFSI